MNAFCMLIQNEKDPKKFNCLVAELDRLLTTKRESIPRRSDAWAEVERQFLHIQINKPEVRTGAITCEPKECCSAIGSLP
jgi:hypothetical protein